jgi:2-iminobutanoate/2-iminopropanoate deaminase
MRKVVRTNKAPQPRAAYSQAIVANGFVFLAGQLALNPETNEFELGDIRSETRLALENMRALLEASGSSLHDVVRVRVFLADLNDFEGMNEVYREFFPVDPPVRTTVGVALSRIKVEIDCIAQLQRTRKKKRV